MASQVPKKPDTSFLDFVPHPGHIIWPLLYALLAAACGIACLCLVLGGRRYDGPLTIAVKLLGFVGFGALAVWQGWVFYDRLDAWARPLGGIGSVLIVSVVAAFFLWNSSTGGSYSSSDGSTHYYRHYDTYIDYSSRISVRDSAGVNIISNSPHARQTSDQMIAYSRRQSRLYRPY